MRCAYVGIISRFGLESLYEERRHTTAFLLRRVARRHVLGAVCFWAVMSPEMAAQIQLELMYDHRAEALLLLQSLAQELGRRLPESIDQGLARKTVNGKIRVIVRAFRWAASTAEFVKN